MDESSHLPGKGRINFRWLVRLRWIALAGQAAVVLWAEKAADLHLPLTALLGVIGVGAFSNVVASLVRTANERTTGRLMLFDALLLTLWLFLSGGPLNPFSTLYLVNVTLAAVVLSPRRARIQLAASLACFGSLFFLQEAPRRLGLEVPTHAELMRLHLAGMWVAFAAAAAAIVYFVHHVTNALAIREAELAAARDLAARREKLAALATLAAGAAHELATPLGTIALISEELTTVFPNGEPQSDLLLLREQVARCRSILDQMAADAGQLTGERLTRMRLGECAVAACAQLEDRERSRVEVVEATQARDQTVQVPPRALAAAVSGLLRNALQASVESVELRVDTHGARACLEIVDRGVGMSSEVLRRAGEPFFTTKGPGHGMGLGLFLSRALAEQLGGELELFSRPGQGTMARLSLPRVEGT